MKFIIYIDFDSTWVEIIDLSTFVSPPLSKKRGISYEIGYLFKILMVYFASDHHRRLYSFRGSKTTTTYDPEIINKKHNFWKKNKK